MANQENEIQKMYEKLKTRLSDERIDLLRRYFEAANNFYKIIPLKRLLRIINSQNSEPYNEADFLEYVEILQNEEHFFAIIGMEELFDDKPSSAPINRLLIHDVCRILTIMMNCYHQSKAGYILFPKRTLCWLMRTNFTMKLRRNTRLCMIFARRQQKSAKK